MWQHVPALDGLRAAAVVAVLLFHAGHLRGGFLGVDLFFALSGFLITSLLLRDAEHGGVHLVEFWGRRFRRLLPAVFVLIAAVALGAWLLGTPAELDGVRRTGGWSLAYMANWHFITQADGYWVSFDQPSMFDHLWSLAIEEQFYVVWPLVVLAVWKFSRRRYRHRNLLAISLAGVAASFVAMLVLYEPGTDPTRIYMGTDTRAASILVGAAMATAPARQAATAAITALGRRTDYLIAVLLIGIGVSWVVVDGATSAGLYRGGLLVHSAAAAAVVAALVSTPNSRVGHALSWRPLVWVGVRSYGLYLWHWPVYVMLSSERTGIDGFDLTTVRIAVSAALAAVSFWLVEDPIRHRATWVRDRRGIPALAGAVVLVATTLIVLPHPRREIAAFDPGSIVVPSVVNDGPPSSLGAPIPNRSATSIESSNAALPVTTSTSAPAPPTSAASPSAGSTTAERSRSTAVPTTTATTATTTVPPAPRPQVIDPQVIDGGAAPPTRRITSVNWTGDSVAYDLAPAVGAALTSAGLQADSNAYLGMRLIGDGEFALLPRLRTALPTTDFDVVVVQLSLWDAEHDAAAQRAALDELHTLVVGDGGRLVFVSPPPTIDTARDGLLHAMTAHARTIADGDPSTYFLDSTAVWGAEFDADLDGDGTPERKRDGVHVCPSGAARFALWLTAELEVRFDGLEPTPPTEWATGAWVTDDRYDQPVGSCAGLTG